MFGSRAIAQVKSVCRTAAAGLFGIGSALAQDFPGAKPDPTGAATLNSPSGGGFGSLLNVLVALGIVYAILRFAMPKVLARWNKRLETGAGSAIRIEESASFAGGSLYVVSARGKTLLLAVGTQGVQSLADLTEPAGKKEPETFGEMVERELKAEQPTMKAACSPEVNDDSAAPDWAAALERLERLAS